MLVSFTIEHEERYRISDRWKQSENLPDSLPAGYEPTFHFHIEGPEGTTGQFYLARKKGSDGEFLFHADLVKPNNRDVILSRCLELSMDLLMADDKTKLLMVSDALDEICKQVAKFEKKEMWLVWKPDHRQSARRWVDEQSGR